MPKEETIEEQALRIARSLPTPNSSAERIAEELREGFREDEIAACLTQGCWPSELPRPLVQEAVWKRLRQ